MEVLKLIIDGRSTKQIAVRLHRSVRTVEIHRYHLMHKLGVDNVVDLVKKAAAMGLLKIQ
jgi:DNA-binding CsgD family transcriptional regulator